MMKNTAQLKVQSVDNTLGNVSVIKRVLIVDDSRVQRRILSSYFKQWGYEVLEADSGHTALEICQSEPIDLILSDWMMPGMNGLEFCKAFRNLKRDSYGYFILLTSKPRKRRDSTWT